MRASDFDVQGSYGLWGLLGVLLFAQTGSRVFVVRTRLMVSAWVCRDSAVGLISVWGPAPGVLLLRFLNGRRSLSRHFRIYSKAPLTKSLALKVQGWYSRVQHSYILSILGKCAVGLSPKTLNDCAPRTMPGTPSSIHSHRQAPSR